MRVAEGGGGVGEQEFTLRGVLSTFRVNQDGTTTPIVQITCYAPLYGITFTFFATETAFQADGARNLANLMTAAVNAVAAHPHVQAMRSEQDQDRSGLLNNYAVITVGTEDLAITTDVTQRMDHLDTTGTFGLIDEAWARLVKLGATES